MYNTVLHHDVLHCAACYCINDIIFTVVYHSVVWYDLVWHGVMMDDACWRCDDELTLRKEGSVTSSTLPLSAVSSSSPSSPLTVHVAILRPDRVVEPDSIPGQVMRSDCSLSVMRRTCCMRITLLMALLHLLLAGLSASSSWVWLHMHMRRYKVREGTVRV